MIADELECCIMWPMRSWLRCILTGAIVALSVLAISPAHAEWHGGGWHGGGWHGGGWHGGGWGWRGGHPGCCWRGGVFIGVPPPVYIPPPVYYRPPPVYY